MEWSLSRWFVYEALNFYMIAHLIDFQVLAIVCTGMIVVGLLAGYGQHQYYLSDGDIIEIRKLRFLSVPPVVCSLAASKISICLLLLRILGKTWDRFKRWFLIAVIVIMVAVAVLGAGYTLGQCQPVKKLWNPSTPGHCQDPYTFTKIGYAHGGQHTSVRAIVTSWLVQWPTQSPTLP